MHTRLFDEDPIGGRRRLFHFDHETGQATIETQQEVEEIVEASKALHRYHDERTPFKHDMVQVASIPMSLWGELERQGIAQDQERLRKWLNDRDNQVFRTRPGRV